MTFDEYFSRGVPKVNAPNVFRTSDGQYVNDQDQPLRVINNSLSDDPAMWTYQDELGKIYTPKLHNQQPTVQNMTEDEVQRASDRKAYKDQMNAWADRFNTAGNVLMDVAGYIPAGKAIPMIGRPMGIIENLSRPRLREHLFAARAPIKYNDIGGTIKRLAKGVLSGKRADIENPYWANKETFSDLRALIEPTASYSMSKEEREKYLEDRIRRAANARFDAWRLYNRLPQKYNTFVKNKNYPGAYTALDDINTLATIPENATFDFVNSAGGMTGKQIDTILGEEKYIPELNEMPAKFGITTISDRWDLHPFSAYDNRLITKVKRAYGKHVYPKLNKISNFVEKNADKYIYDLNAEKEWYNAHKEYADYLMDVGMDYQDVFKKSGLTARLAESIKEKAASLSSIPKFKFLNTLDKKLANFEPGERIFGAKPFLVVNEVPWTNRMIGKYVDYGKQIPITERQAGFHSKQFLPTAVKDWKRYGIKPKDKYIKTFNTDIAK